MTEDCTIYCDTGDRSFLELVEACNTEVGGKQTGFVLNAALWDDGTSMAINLNSSQAMELGKYLINWAVGRGEPIDL